MNTTSLVLSAAAMGLAALPHCAAMCGSSCAALSRSGQAASGSLMAGRLLSYAAAGALAATSVGLLQQGLLQWSPLLRPLWTLLQLAWLALGLVLLSTGAWPVWLRSANGLLLASAGTTPARGAGGNQRGLPVTAPVRWLPSTTHRGHATRAGLIGLLWIAWPCGLSQSALLLASLSDTAQAGAAVMTAFALVSAPGLVAGPWLLARLVKAIDHRQPGQGMRWLRRAEAGGWANRLAGGMMAAAAAWALTHGLWSRVAAWCFG